METNLFLRRRVAFDIPRALPLSRFKYAFVALLAFFLLSFGTANAQREPCPPNSVMPAPQFVKPCMDICEGDIITLAANPGYTAGPYTTSWSSSGTAVITLTPIPPAPSNTAVVTGISAGSVTITYEVTTADGCKGYAYCNFDVHPRPDSITGDSVICGLNNTTTLSSATPGGTWSSSNTTVATVDASGVVTGVSYGTAVITYSAPPLGCFTTFVITIAEQPQPFFIQCGEVICQYKFQPVFADPGYTGPMAPGYPAWSWTSLGGSVAITPTSPTTANIQGIAQGVVVIHYTVKTAQGCVGVAHCTINVAPAPDTVINGPDTLCVGDIATYTNATPGGVWSSTDPTIATVDPVTGVVTAIKAGVVTIRYSIITNVECDASKVIHVFPTPKPVIRQCAERVCLGMTDIIVVDPGIPISDIASVSWVSSNIIVATVAAIGSGYTSATVTGGSVGTAIITYTVMSIHGCVGSVTCTVAVDSLPPIVGDTVICVGATKTLTNAVSGGFWVSGNTAVATVSTDPSTGDGIVTGVSGGTVYISYIWGKCFVVHQMVVKDTPVPSFIQCAHKICEGNYQPVFADPTYAAMGYITSWSVINGTGGLTYTVTSPSSIMIFGGPVGTATIVYTVQDPVTGCIGRAYCEVVINPVPAPIVGPTTVCPGTTFTVSCPSPGGTWMSDDPSIASIDAFGVVTTYPPTGISTGAVTIDYVYPASMGGCMSQLHLTVVLQPEACVEWAPSATACTCNTFIFHGTVGATVNYAITCPGSAPTTYALPMTSATIELPPGSYPAMNCELCIISIDYMGCQFPCYCPTGNCCAEVGSPKPGRGPDGYIAPISPVSASIHTDLKVIPNPNKGAFTLSGEVLGLSNRNVKLEITDVLGKIIYKDVLTVENGKVNMAVSLGDNFARGVYLIRVKSDEVSHVVRFTLD